MKNTREVHFIIGTVTTVNEQGAVFQSNQDFTAELDAERLLEYMRSCDPEFQGTVQAIQECFDRGATCCVQELRADGWQFHLLEPRFMEMTGLVH